jgi:putative transposon-encoded protein
MEKFTVTVSGYEQVEKTAVKVGNGAGVLVPRRWLGHRVHCILLDEGEVEPDDSTK